MLRRMTTAMIVVLVVGVPLIGALYFFDQYRDPGPTLDQRTIAAAEALVRRQPNLVSARIALADAYARAGRPRDAVTQYGEVLREQPTHVAALLGRAAAYEQLGDLDAAAKDYQAEVDAAGNGEMARVDPQLEAAYYGLGAIALKRGDAAQAAVLLDKALAIQPTDADALYLFASARLALGDARSAIEPLRDAVALVPTGWREPYDALSQAYAKQGDAAGSRYATAMSAFCAGHPDEARTTLESLVSGPHAADALLGLGLIAEQSGDGETAAAYYARVLNVDPGNFNAVSGMGRVMDATASAAQTASPAAPSVAWPEPAASDARTPVVTPRPSASPGA